MIKLPTAIKMPVKMPTVCDLTSVQRSLNEAASTITDFLREPAADHALYRLASSSGEVASAVTPLRQMGHSGLATKLLQDSNALDGAFISKVGPGSVPKDLPGMRDRILEGVALLHKDISDIAKVPDFR